MKLQITCRVPVGDSGLETRLGPGLGAKAEWIEGSVRYGNENFFPELWEKIFLFHRESEGTAEATTPPGSAYSRAKCRISRAPTTLQDLSHLDCDLHLADSGG